MVVKEPRKTKCWPRFNEPTTTNPDWEYLDPETSSLYWSEVAKLPSRYLGDGSKVFLPYRPKDNK